MDLLTGGSGVCSGSPQRILDFDKLDNVIDLMPRDAEASVAGHPDVSLIGEHQFSAEGQVPFVHEADKSIVKAIVAGATGAAEISLDGVFDMDARDFRLDPVL